MTRSSDQVERHSQTPNMIGNLRIAHVPVMARYHCRSRRLTNRRPDCPFDTISNRLLGTGVDKHTACLANFAQDFDVRSNDRAATGYGLDYRQAKSFGVRTKEKRRRSLKQSGDILIAQSASKDEISDTGRICQRSCRLKGADNGDGSIRARTSPPLPDAYRVQHPSEILLPSSISEQDKAVSRCTSLGFKTLERIGDSVGHNANSPARFWPMPNQFICGRLRNRDQCAPRCRCARDRVVIEPFSKPMRLRFSKVNQVMDNKNLPPSDEWCPIIAGNEKDIRARLTECPGEEPPIRWARRAWAASQFGHLEVADHPVAIFTRDPPNPVRGNPATVEKNTHRVNDPGNIRVLLNFSCEAE